MIAGFCESVLRLMVAVLASILCPEIVPEPALAERQVNNLGPQQQLERAVNDARSVSAAFASFGFDLVHVENVGRGACNAAGQKVLAELQPGDPAAIYVSGRGVAVEDLLPQFAEQRLRQARAAKEGKLAENDKRASGPPHRQSCGLPSSAKSRGSA